ncbi:helix-turn-helix domain-containing protein [Thioclava litoralis]|uniref:helix-turn-helix domain-containing protein n=1 Tax=Thioclava litoralis TaxID=3076557 RepID=UPI00338F5045
MTTIAEREFVKSQLRIAGSSMAAVGRELGLTRSTVAGVVAGTCRSARVERAVAEKIGMPREQLWPSRFMDTGDDDVLDIR